MAHAKNFISARPHAAPAKASKASRKIPRKRRVYTRAEITGIFERLAAREPDPKTELHYSSPFTLLVAVVLSAQATDIGVNKATRVLFRIADTPEKMLELGEAGVIDCIKTIGLFRNKAKNVIALSQKLLAEHGGCVPQDRAALEALPGVGRKTANVVLNTAFGAPTIAVDTHIFRLANRLRLAPGKTPLEVEQELLRIVPEPYLRNAHHWLILHGRYVCKARRPECWRCSIADLCKSLDKDTTPPRAAIAKTASNGIRVAGPTESSAD